MTRFQILCGPSVNVGKNISVFNVSGGANVTDTIDEAIWMASCLHGTIRFDFNGVTISVRSDSNPQLIYREWSRSISGCTRRKAVHPYPKRVLTRNKKLRDARVEERNMQAEQKHRSEYQAQLKLRRDAVEAKLVNSPGIELANEGLWQEFMTLNEKSIGVMTYSERWARLMQVEMALGKNLEDIAEATSHETDLEGMSGASYTYAVGILSSCWKYGEQLRRWHNLDSQIGDEGEKANESGGVLNLAVLVFG